MRTRLFIALIAAFAVGCSGSSSKPIDEEPETSTATFAKGADLSWITEMESDGIKFYNASGEQTECTALMKSLGMNAIRLRVWVDPTGGWCNKVDVLVKARRAKQLGMRLLLTFHYSDFFADPARQTKPAAWESYSLDGLCSAVGAHTVDVLSALKAEGIEPEWVAVGNETRAGMLWPEGKIVSGNFASYVRLSNAGYNAVKSIFPAAKVMVHIDRGDESSTWFFDAFKAAGGKWDIVGLSLYPDYSAWSTALNKCMANVTTLIQRYSTDVMICEVGMDSNRADECYSLLSGLITRSSAIEGAVGVFYWEPECYGGWKPAVYNSLGWSSYGKGAFDSNGRPTHALDAFKQ